MLKVTPRLNELLEEKGYSQAAFAKKYGFAQKTINSFDGNKQHRTVLLFGVARALGLNVEDLFLVEEIPDTPDTEGSEGV
ncbi:DNA-binding transcriptional regulator, XRE-family HTH domain [Paenibacillus sophorae]|uniref:Transcriptional regulator n=1 Tax=Paenibacillus sophorae TaxID=1333845 RepID=A0A1H8JJC5_9BACL|nr:helix-turn-helix domain-containing protein [Paenibacillus sophorae]QWU13382.1 transcriptional regulator [Paenibacillus sophorae]SEN80830.1 DNA-binding transcriptional regulator, XRE-family HTH domain [Paenibacillus sophorae]